MGSVKRAVIGLLLASCTATSSIPPSTMASTTSPTASVADPTVTVAPASVAATQTPATTPSASAVAPCHAVDGLPDPACTPGATNPDVTPATIAITICVSGWTATVRPPSTYTNALKVDQMKAYGYGDQAPGDFEEDHLIPLELGGAPRDPMNLWPEPLSGDAGAVRKDSLENRLHEAVCAGTMALADAQQCIATNWIACLGSTTTVTPPPASAPPSATATASPTTAAAFGVTITTSLWGSLAAVTAAGATCNARARLPSGSYSQAQGITAQKVADAGGNVSWTWTRTSSTTPGTGTYTVSCVLGGASASATSTFSVP